VFFEAFAEWGDERLDVAISERVMAYVQARPSDCLYEYLVATPEDVRVAAVKRFSDGSEALRQRIEANSLGVTLPKAYQCSPGCRPRHGAPPSFDGELTEDSHTYPGTGTISYAW
jgi:hypothetical protein